MRKWFASVQRIIPGFICGILSVLTACFLIRRVDMIFHWIGSACGIEERQMAQAEQVLAQLRQAELSPAWLPLLIFGIAAGAALLFVRQKVAAVLLWMLLFGVLTVLAIGLCSVNGVKVVALLSCFLPMLPSL